VLVNPANPAGPIQATDLRSAASRLGLVVDILNAASEREIDAGFASLAELQIGALLISSDAFFNSQCERFAALASRYGVKAISLYREFPAAGGLMSYGTSITDLYRQAALYTGRILKGEKPADLPVQQATKVELILNLKAAKALGVTFPLTLLARADEVIE
jgi:putative ABC transport system substrate-binding protein